MSKKRLYYFSHLFLFLTGTTYLLDLFTGGKLYELFVLTPNAVANSTEWWRLLTFPLAFDSPEGILLFIIAFLVIAPKLEETFQSWLYPLILLIVTSIQGVVYTAIFSTTDVSLSGTAGLNVFVLTVFTLINIRKRLVVLKTYYVPVSLFVLAIVFVWYITTFLHAIYLEKSILVYESSYSLIFGIISGALVFLQLKFTNFPRKNEKLINDERISVPRPEELSLAVIANNELKKVNRKLQEDLDRVSEYPKLELTEENLNDILDKVNTSGIESLTTGEKQFLDKYSKEL